MTIQFDPDELVWGQKYRPKTLDEVILPEAFKSSLRTHLKDGRVPSMLFYSPSPGTGKTTTAFAICNDLDVKPLYINASLNNSIDDIRSNVFQYATTASLFGSAQKVVILDEAERLSKAAQDSLKGLIEQVSKNCSFILTANSKTSIIDPLRSRCTEIDFVYDKQDQMKIAVEMLKRSMTILDMEKVEYDKPSVAALVKKFSPDNRKILGELQRYSNENGKIDAGVLGRLKGADQETLLAAMKQKEFDNVKAWVQNNSDRLGDDFYITMYRTLEPLVQPQSVPQIALTLNDYQRYHSVIPDRFIHFLAMVTQLMMEIQYK